MPKILFQIWILSFLFYKLDLIGSLSIDNLLLPVLVVTWLFLRDKGSVRVGRQRKKVIIFTSVVFLGLILIEFIKLKGNASFTSIIPVVTEHLKHFGYILIPLLYINSEKDLHNVFKSIVIVTIINCIFAIFGAIGMAPSFVQAAESSRIPWLLRARGPIANLGDSAILITFTGLIIFALPKNGVHILAKGFFKKAIIASVLIGGILASQSRNVILTVALVAMLYYWLDTVASARKSQIRKIISLLAVLVIIIVAVMVVTNFETILRLVTNMFGVSGEGTVRDRLGSYGRALEILQDSMVLGLDATTLIKEAVFISSLHNMWLGLTMISGVFGLSLIVGLILYALKGSLHLLKNSDYKSYGILLTTFILAALLFSPNFYPGHTAFVIWFFIGLSLTTWQLFYFSPLNNVSENDIATGDIKNDNSNKNLKDIPKRDNILQRKKRF